MDTSRKHNFLKLVRHSCHVQNLSAKPWKAENEVKIYDTPMTLTNDLAYSWLLLNKMK